MVKLYYFKPSEQEGIGVREFPSEEEAALFMACSCEQHLAMERSGKVVLLAAQDDFYKVVLYRVALQEFGVSRPAIG
ncbi:hypothetical protein ACFSKU_10815 [Pontibacter silvestris]|uniref:Uncharacterized protein n=1 Tax=Pontibacter silvestris TaxID=2305183 RepID=A0ABW4WXA8_9BACT|nr:hypothetical protein [Pontibacter silvestris]MCC9138994.1 hypothetical protein [Pontibacter silvestris]